MPFSPPSLSFRPDLPFKYIGGEPSIDFVNTVDWTSEGLKNDRLTDYARLTEWAKGAEVVSKEMAQALRDIAEERPREAETTFDGVRHTRWILQRVFSGLGSDTPDEQALVDFNGLLGDSLRRLEIQVEGTPENLPLWTWRGLGEDLASPLWLVVWSAAQLLTSEEASRVRVCDGPDCGWMFVDRSRNGLRRWCDMATCGTRAKSRRRARRNRASAPAGS